MTRPLDGLLVASLEQAIAAPYCTRLLADLGARVIKVERPEGDFARNYDRRARGLSSHFVWTNRSKESLVLDLKEESARDALLTILANADVFVQNLAPGAADRLGLSPAVLAAINPRLITCSISGYGDGGPYQDRKAYDLLVQAESGFLSVTGTTAEPVKAGISVADIAAGVSAYNAILAALLNRHRTGKGDHIAVSMLEAMAEWMGFPLYYALDGAGQPPRAGAGHATIFPYGPYGTADGMVLFGLQNEREWKAFCEGVLMQPELADDPRFSGGSARADNREAVNGLINAVLGTLSTGEAIDRLEASGIATGRIRDMDALWHHEQLEARGRWVEVSSPAGPMPALKPVSGAGWQPRMDAIPALGQHTDAILAEFGIASKHSG